MPASDKINTISILGCGWYGFDLGKNLLKAGYKVKGSTTSADKLEKLRLAGIQAFNVMFDVNTETYQPEFFDCDILVISIPPKRSSTELAFYADKIKRIKEAINRHQVKRVLFISSTSVYGDHNTEVTENAPPLPDSESGKAILAGESILKNSSEFTTTIIRFCGLIGLERNPARFFSGKKNIPNGKAPVNLIHLDDCIAISMIIIEKDFFGYLFNACSSSHPPKMEFYKQQAINNGLELPEFMEELNNWKIVSSDYLNQILGYSVTTL